jgi:primosomal protein N' (replication factor Y)
MVAARGSTSGPPRVSAEPVAAEPDAGPVTLVAGPVCAQVVVGLPVPRVFTYIVPCELVDRLAVGQRVRVPFRARSRIGVVVGLGRRLGESGDGAGIRAPANGPPGLERLQAVVEPVPALTPALLALTRWAAEETASTWGDAVARALPPGIRSGAPATLLPERRAEPSGPVVLITGAGRGDTVAAEVARVLGQDAAVLVLAPEIDTARQWAERLGRRLGFAVSLATSAETPRRRWQTWWAARQGDARIVVGTRAAAFVPVNPLGLTVVLDEEDPAHKAPDAPCWHARELAIERAAQGGGPCLLAAAAPSLESWVRVESGRAEARATGGGGWPAVHRVDLRGDEPARALSAELRDAGRAALAAGRSVLLFLNRLGYGRVLACAECGAVRRCPTCRLALTFHQAARALGCRLCGAVFPARSLCPRCRGRRLGPVGWGTERIEAEARAAFPGITVARYDGTVEPKHAAAVRTAFARGEVRVVVGTQMVLRLAAEAPVGVAALVHADVTLGLPDFRAAERTLQTAWRLAEAITPGGSLWLQTAHPDHPALLAVAAGAYDGFYRREWAERQELGYPPARRMARLLVQGPRATGLAGELAAAGRVSGLAVLGPAALAGRRVQVVLLGGAELPRAVADLLAPLRGRRRLGATRLSVDVDPVELP